jgi:isopropylmalate/homocitrate/citramalate synthase
MRPSEHELIYDWNVEGVSLPAPGRTIEFDDETLRDGLQSPSVTSPSIEKKVEILHLIDKLGIQTADIGLPGAGPHVVEHVMRLAQEIRDARLKVTANCAARTLESDIRPVAEISQKVGIPIEVCTFIGSSPIRQYAEDWDVERMLKHTVDAVTFAVKEGLTVMYVTEDTTRAHPDTLEQLFRAAVDAGAKRLCLCDTCGHATPAGAANLVHWAKEWARKVDPSIKIDWHGHSDRGLGVINSIAAIASGADRIHGCAIGIGERVGNTPMDQLLVNLKLMGWIDNDLSALPEYTRVVSESCEVPIPINYPVVGRDAFRTGTGVHAAAVIKAYKKGDAWLADRVYSGVPASMVGREQEIEVGPMCGLSNVQYWLEHHGYKADDALVQAVFKAAKASPRVLTDAEVHDVAKHVA